MQRPIEKYEWKQRKSSKEIFIYDKERTNKLLIFIPQKDTILLDSFLELSFEELQAIYETAKQIKEEK